MFTAMATDEAAAAPAETKVVPVSADTGPGGRAAASAKAQAASVEGPPAQMAKGAAAD